MSTTTLGSCTCVQSFQDALYGKSIRVFNECKPPSAGSVKRRCTGCGRDIIVNAPKKEAA